MRRTSIVTLLLGVTLAACGGAPSTGGNADLPAFDAASFRSTLADTERPMIVNVWASWCIPCRSETPLLVAAHGRYGDQIDFLGVDVQDDLPSAGAFIDEFGVEWPSLFDRNGDVRSVLGGIGTPITYFVLPGGELSATHIGVIDEQQLALQIDELLKRSQG